MLKRCSQHFRSRTNMLEPFSQIFLFYHVTDKCLLQKNRDLLSNRNSL